MLKERLNILMVEDNEDHAELMFRCLEDLHVPVTVAHVDDGDKALKYLLAEAEYSGRAGLSQPDLILLDLRIPKVDGLTVLSRIKQSETLRRIPVVVLTSSENDQDVARAYENHVNSYLVKPVDYDRFMEMLDEIGSYWFGWNKPPRNQLCK